MEEAILNRLQKGITDHVFPGAVFGVVNKKGERQIFTAGRLTYDTDSPPVTADTIYDLASITKAIPGSTSLLKLIDEGRLSLEDRVVDYVPEFGNFENKKEVRIKHILTYTLDLELPSASSLKDLAPEAIMETTLKAPLKNPPGARYIYTNSTALFIGLIVEKLTGLKLDQFADQTFFEPLGMARTTFYPSKFKKEEIAPTEIDDWRGRLIQGEVHDESTWILRQKYVPAIAGLFSTAPDLLNFLEMLLNRGMKNERRYFSEKIVKEMGTNQLDQAINDQAGLGWEMNWPAGIGTNASKSAFFKSGFTGTIVVIDPVKEIAFTLLTNRTYPKRPKDNLAITEVRRDISNLIFQAI